MKYVIWGTGGAAKRFLNENFLCFFVNGEIVSVVDSNPDKEGKKFFGCKIISPERLKNIVYDRLIICSSFYEEIIIQMESMGLDTVKAKTVAEIKEEFVDCYINQYGIMKKNILILGADEKYDHMFQFYKEYFERFSFLPLEQLNRLDACQYDYILLSELSNTKYNLLGEDELTLEEKVISELGSKFDVDRSGVLPSAAFQLIYKNCERTVSYGICHADKTFLEIRLLGPAGWGYIFGVVSKNISYAYQKGYIPVVNMMSAWNIYLEENEVGKVNAWEKFFEQPAGYTMEEVLKSRNVVIAPQEQTKEYYNENFYQQLVMKPRLRKMFDSYMETFRNRGKVLGVLFRGTDYANLKPYNHYVQPSLPMMLEKVEEKFKEWGGFDSVYLCTEVEEAVQAFAEKFGEKVFYYPQMRYPEQCSDYLGKQKFDREEDAFYRGAEYWILLSALAECNSLVAGNCGGTSTVLQMNRGKYENIFLFDLGKYGFQKVQTE